MENSCSGSSLIASLSTREVLIRGCIQPGPGDSTTEVAKDAAHVILLEKDLGIQPCPPCAKA